MGELDALRARLERLEARRRYAPLLILLGVLLFGAWAVRGDAVAGAKPATVEVGRLVLRDADGEIVCQLYSNDAGVWLQLARKGPARIQLAVDAASGPRIRLWDRDGVVRQPVLEEVPEARKRNEAARKKKAERQRHTRIARGQCERYYDLVRTWKLLTKSKGGPADLHDIEKPLKPGGDPFTKIEQDPWGGQYFIEMEGRRFRIVSPGPDGIDGTEDDIVYPERKN